MGEDIRCLEPGCQRCPDHGFRGVFIAVAYHQTSLGGNKEPAPVDPDSLIEERIDRVTALLRFGNPQGFVSPQGRGKISPDYAIAPSGLDAACRHARSKIFRMLNVTEKLSTIVTLTSFSEKSTKADLLP